MRDLTVALVASLLVACGGGGGSGGGGPDPDIPATPPGLEVAWTVDGCAPWDGPATSIFLAHEPPTAAGQPAGHPHLWLSLYRARSELSGRAYEWTSEADVGGARWCPEADRCSSATEVRVAFRRQPSDSADLVGEFTAVFQGDTVAGGFRAPLHRGQRALCG